MIASMEILAEYDVERRSYAQHTHGKLGHSEAKENARKHGHDSETQATAGW